MVQRRTVLAAVGGGLSLAGCLRLESSDGPESSGRVNGTNLESGDAPAATTATARVTEDPTEERSETTESNESTTALEGSWEQFRGDVANTGVSTTATGPDSSVETSWRVETPEGIGVYSSPVVADGVAVVLADEGLLLAVETAAGDVVWRQQFPADSDSIGSPAVVDGSVFAGPLDGPSFYALNATSGAYRWETTLDAGTFASPTVADGVVYVPTTTGTVYALDAADGSVRWKYETGGRTVLGSPAFHDDELYVVSTTPNELPSGVDDLFDLLYYDRFYRWGRIDEDPHATVASLDANATLHVLDAATGERVGGRQFPDFVVSTPTVADDAVFVPCWDGNVYALEVGSGDERWVGETDAPISGSPAVADGVLYCGNWRGTLHAFDTTGGGSQWFVPVGASVGSSPSVADGSIYVTGAGGGLTALEANGAVEWQFDGADGGFNASSPAVVDDALLVCGETGSEDASQGALFRLDAP